MILFIMSIQIDGVIIKGSTSPSYPIPPLCDVYQLGGYIQLIYDTCPQFHRSISIEEYANIRNQVVTGAYSLSPIVHQFMSEEAAFNENITSPRLDVMFCKSHMLPIPRYRVIRLLPCISDGLVLCSLVCMLSQTLCRKWESLTPQSIRSNLDRMGRVDRLYVIDLYRSIRISPKRLLSALKLHMGKDHIINSLIYSFFQQPLIKDIGERWSMRWNRLYPQGEILRPLLDIMLHDLHD